MSTNGRPTQPRGAATQTNQLFQPGDIVRFYLVDSGDEYCYMRVLFTDGLGIAGIEGNLKSPMPDRTTPVLSWENYLDLTGTAVLYPWHSVYSVTQVLSSTNYERAWNGAAGHYAKNAVSQ